MKQISTKSEGIRTNFDNIPINPYQPPQLKFCGWQEMGGYRWRCWIGGDMAVYHSSMDLQGDRDGAKPICFQKEYIAISEFKEKMTEFLRKKEANYKKKLHERAMQLGDL